MCFFFFFFPRKKKIKSTVKYNLLNCSWILLKIQKKITAVIEKSLPNPASEAMRRTRDMHVRSNFIITAKIRIIITFPTHTTYSADVTPHSFWLSIFFFIYIKIFLSLSVSWWWVCLCGCECVSVFWDYYWERQSLILFYFASYTIHFPPTSTS